MLLCTTVGGPNFLRIPPSFEDKGTMFSTGLPLWLEAKKLNSLPKWILMYLERSIWVHYSSTISCKFPPDCVKSLWLQPESKLINFKYEILPFWADFCQKLKAQPDIVLKLYQDLEAAARQQIEVEDELNPLTGGLNFKIYRFDLDLALKNMKSTLLNFKNEK
jgi:hypothetical protein